VIIEKKGEFREGDSGRRKKKTTRTRNSDVKKKKKAFVMVIVGKGLPKRPKGIN